MAKIILVWCAMLFMTASYCQDNNTGKTLTSDDSLALSVDKKINSSAFYGIFDWVSVSAKNGLVTLDGWAHLPWLPAQLQKIAEKQPGVKSVVNHIQKTMGPGKIGFQAAQVIYNDPSFYGRSFGGNAPIHIIVNGGTLLLEGAVNSEAESKQVQMLVENFTNAVHVNNDLAVIR